MLRFQCVLDVLVELLVASSGFCEVDVATTDDLTVRSVKVQGACHVLKLWKCEVL